MRFLKLSALLGAAVASSALAAWAYLAPAIFTMAPVLAQDADDMHAYIHSSHPGSLSGFASHDYDDAMGALDFELLKLSLGVSTEAKVLGLKDRVGLSFNRFRQTIQLEGLLPTDPTLASLWTHLENEHVAFMSWFEVKPAKKSKAK